MRDTHSIIVSKILKFATRSWSSYKSAFKDDKMSENIARASDNENNEMRDENPTDYSKPYPNVMGA